MIFVILLFFGMICALVAHGKGRSPIGWFVIGCIAPVLGTILVFVLPDQKKAESRYNRLGQQNRRLRERLRQQQLANRQKLARVNRRLSAHDRSLDLDTADDDSAPGLPYEDDEDQEADDDEPLSYTTDHDVETEISPRPMRRPTRPATQAVPQRRLASQVRRTTGVQRQVPARALPAREVSTEGDAAPPPPRAVPRRRP